MPIGYLFTVALVCWGVACALTRWRRPGRVSAIPALLVNELPFIVGYLLIASTVLALAEGDLDSVAGSVGAACALLALAGLGLVGYRATLAHAALGTEGRPYRPWGRILRAPLFPDLTGKRAMVCVSANYRLQPGVTLADQVDDARAAVAWVRAHVSEFGGDPGALFVTGSSAGAYLAVCLASEGGAGQGGAGIAGLIGRYGYYGDLAPRGDLPPLLVIHSSNDLLVPAADARAFAERVRAASGNPVRYAELPGGHHDFDLFESIRSVAVYEAVAAFIAESTQSTPPVAG
jgi:dienelactone hydrolase